MMLVYMRQLIYKVINLFIIKNKNHRSYISDDSVVILLYLYGRETGLEPATNGFGDRYSTIELLPTQLILYNIVFILSKVKNFLVYIRYIIGRCKKI